MRNPVVRKGEKGGFKWVFRRFWLEIETLSGNFKARWTADEHPYAYLISGKNDDNIHGFCQMVYYLSKTITADQGLVNDIQKAFTKYQKRLGKTEQTDDEEAAIAEVRAVQEHVEMPDRERKKAERNIDRRLKKTVKRIENEERANQEG